MNNLVYAIGRITSSPEIKKTESGKEVCNLTLAVPRNYKNENGAYDTDFIDVVLFNGIATNTCEYCKKGDLVGIKGRIQTTNYETEDGMKHKKTDIIVEKISFLCSYPDKVQNEIDNK